MMIASLSLMSSTLTWLDRSRYNRATWIMLSRFSSGGAKQMSLPQSYVSYSVDEYLALEREAEERHEYLDGQIYEMAGESPEHGAICDTQR